MANQVLPVSSSRPAPNGAPFQDDYTHITPNGVMNILQSSVRLGNTGPSQAVGLVQKIEWSMSRNTKEIYQIEAMPDMLFGEHIDVDITQPGRYSVSELYYPGEPVEIVPGVMNPIELTLDRAVMNSGTGLEALLLAGDAAEYQEYNNGTGYAPFITNSTDLNGNPTRGITPLQQVRPFNLFSLFYSPTTGDVIYGLKFVDNWIEDISGWNIEAAGDAAIIESVKMKAPKVRLYYPPPG